MNTKDESTAAADVGLLVLRLGIGVTLFLHGSQKLFGWFNGSGIDGFAGVLENRGYPAPTLFSTIAAVSEVGAALLLLLGLFTPLGAAAAIGVMINALVVFHLPDGFLGGRADLPTMVIVAAVALALVGPGQYALDARIKWPRPFGWSLARVGYVAIALGSLTGLGTLALRALF